jgi:hypothetical protein
MGWVVCQHREPIKKSSAAGIQVGDGQRAQQKEQKWEFSIEAPAERIQQHEPTGSSAAVAVATAAAREQQEPSTESTTSREPSRESRTENRSGGAGQRVQHRYECSAGSPAQV